MKYAPIVLFTYNRLDTLKITVESLQNNILAKECELFIYSDATKDDNNKLKVQYVREYLYTIEGFKKVHIIERKENFGLAKSIIEGVSEIITQYGQVIVLEDDLLTSKNFLCYMNEALNFYENHQEIFSISAFTMPLKSLERYDKDTYISLRPSSWGWATWKDQWEDIDWNIKDFNVFIQDKKALKQFNRGGIDLVRMLKHYMQKKNNSWAIRWAYTMFKKEKYSIYPKISKVQNIGFGENATHCEGLHIYQTKLDETMICEFNFIDDFVPNDIIINEFRYQYSFRQKFFKKLYLLMKKYF